VVLAVSDGPGGGQCPRLAHRTAPAGKNPDRLTRRGGSSNSWNSLRPISSLLVFYWERKRQGRLAPRRADLDPAEIPSHLPYFYIVDVVDDGADFLVRLAGTQIAASLPRDPTGKLLSEILRDVPDALEDALQLLRTVLEEKRPGYSRGEVFWLRERSYRWFAAVRLPLSEDGATVNRIMGVVTPISCG
jgi:hypothetical protein